MRCIKRVSESKIVCFQSIFIFSAMRHGLGDGVCHLRHKLEMRMHVCCMMFVTCLSKKMCEISRIYCRRQLRKLKWTLYFFVRLFVRPFSMTQDNAWTGEWFAPTKALLIARNAFDCDSRRYQFKQLFNWNQFSHSSIFCVWNRCVCNPFFLIRNLYRFLTERMLWNMWRHMMRFLSEIKVSQHKYV